MELEVGIVEMARGLDSELEGVFPANAGWARAREWAATWDGDLELDDFYQRTRGCKWTEVDPADALYLRNALFYFEPEAWVYYFPAFLRTFFRLAIAKDDWMWELWHLLGGAIVRDEPSKVELLRSHYSAAQATFMAKASRLVQLLDQALDHRTYSDEDFNRSQRIWEAVAAGNGRDSLGD